MDIDPAILRMIERLVVVVGGVLALYFGYKLFVPETGIENSAQKGEIRFGNFLRIHAVRFGPGIFFAAFGAYILTTSLARPVQLSTQGIPPGTHAESAMDARHELTNFKGAIPDVHSESPAALIQRVNAMELALTKQGVHTRELRVSLDESKIQLLKKAFPSRLADVDRYLGILRETGAIPPHLLDIHKIFAPADSAPSI